MERKKSYPSPLHPFLQAKPSRALQEEDAFMQEHGGASARAIFQVVEASAAFFGAIVTAPIALFLRLTRYESPLEARQNSASSRTNSPTQSRRTKDTRHLRTPSQKLSNASSYQHPPSSSKRRA